MKYIDCHAHYGHNRFNKLNKTTSELLEDMSQCTERIINAATNVRTIRSVNKMIEQYPVLYGMMGFFPTDTFELDDDFCTYAKSNRETLIAMLDNTKVVGIGEIGLDYHWNTFGDLSGEDAHKKQQYWFQWQIELAKSKSLPVCIHSRDCEDDTLNIFAQYDSIPGFIHCFSYGHKAADIALEKGLYLGIGGTSTYRSNRELRDVIKTTPLDRLLLETDAPYLTPELYRKEINTSAYIQYVVENIANIKQISPEKVIQQTNENAYRLFQKLKN